MTELLKLAIQLLNRLLINQLKLTIAAKPVKVPMKIYCSHVFQRLLKAMKNSLGSKMTASVQEHMTWRQHISSRMMISTLSLDQWLNLLLKQVMKIRAVQQVKELIQNWRWPATLVMDLNRTYRTTGMMRIQNARSISSSKQHTRFQVMVLKLVIRLSPLVQYLEHLMFAAYSLKVTHNWRRLAQPPK